MTSKGVTDEEIAHAHKCLCLHYLGMSEDDRIDDAAKLMQSTTIEAIHRGFDVNAPVIGS